MVAPELIAPVLRNHFQPSGGPPPFPFLLRALPVVMQVRFIDVLLQRAGDGHRATQQMQRDHGTGGRNNFLETKNRRWSNQSKHKSIAPVQPKQLFLPPDRKSTRL